MTNSSYQKKAQNAKTLFSSNSRRIETLDLPFFRAHSIGHVMSLALIVPHLLLSQTSPLKAMDTMILVTDSPENSTSEKNPKPPYKKRCRPDSLIKTSQQKKQKINGDSPPRNLAKEQVPPPLDYAVSVDSPGNAFFSDEFDPDSQHPLVHVFWRERKISDRLQVLRQDIEKIKTEVKRSQNNLITITERDVERYKAILRSISPRTGPNPLLQGVPCTDLVLDSDSLRDINNGRSGNKVILVSRNGKNFLAIKKFEPQHIKLGLQELFSSLIAFDINLHPQALKMARIWDAVISSDDSLSIIMESAHTHDIHHFLSADLLESKKNGTCLFKAGGGAQNALKACAEYLATFHIAKHRKEGDAITAMKYLTHASEPLFTLIHNPLKKKPESNIELLSLFARKPWMEIGDITSSNIVQILTEEEKKFFINLVKKTCSQFEENSSNVYRLLLTGSPKESKAYFRTITLGDAHGNNLFYTDSDELVSLTGSKVRKDSLLRITAIDYASIIKTYDSVGDPAEDVGRFLGSLWDWAAQQDNLGAEWYEIISTLQDQFLQTYLKKIVESKIFSKEEQESFEKIFQENYNFYKLRFYRALFNAKKHDSLEKDKGIKQKIVKSWIWENSHLDELSLEMPDDPSSEILDASFPEFREEGTTQKQLKGQRYDEMVNKDVTCYYLPSPVANFIETAAEGSKKTYLTLLRNSFHPTEDITASSRETVITGMGGIGKTSLALAYAHKALKKKKPYNLIYWFSAETRSSLLKGYRNLLQDMGISTKDTDDNRITDLIKENLAAKDRCLLIYDNVADSDLLTGIIPEQNIDILITSRRRGGWEERYPRITQLHLNEFRPEDSLKYLLNITNLETNPKNILSAEKLAQTLCHFPLALSHAAHYLKLVSGQAISGTCFEKYIQHFETEGVRCFDTHQNPFKEETREITYENLIVNTLRISKIYLSKLAEKILSYSSYLFSDDIKEDIFLEDEINKGMVQQAIAELSSLSLIKKMPQKPFFSISSLLQKVVRHKYEFAGDHKTILTVEKKINQLFDKKVQQEDNIDTLINDMPDMVKIFEHKIRLNYPFEDIERLAWAIKILYFVGYDAVYATSIPLPARAQRLEFSDKKLKEAVKMIDNKQLLLQLKNTDVPLWLEDLIKNASPRILCAVGLMYSEQANYEKACLWFSKAAHQQDANGQFHLGEIYRKLYWQTSEKMYLQLAAKWYSKAAQQEHKQAQIEQWRLLANEGHRGSQFSLGQTYQLGLGVEQSDIEAFKWYTAAAEGGHADAQFSLGELYFYGQGVEQNHAKASQWFRMVSGKRQGDAHYYLTKIREPLL